MNNTATVFATQKERVNRNGEKYNRLEGYATVADLDSLIQGAKASGKDMVQVLPRVYQKDSKNNLAIELRFFKGTKK